MKPQPQKTLSVFDSVCIIVGIIIGAGIFETAPMIADCMGRGSWTLLIWLIGGLIALAGAVNYAELATAYPKQGGDYVYLKRAYGPAAGFFFGWTQIVIVRPGDIALMAFIFARYASALLPFPSGKLIYAVAAIVLLTGINILGARKSRWTQNLLTVLKVAGLIGIIAAGLLSPHPAQQPEAQELPPAETAVPLALILVMYTFGGWNEMAYVAAEVKNPARNISRAILLGTLTVTVLYLLTNAAFLRTLGYPAMTASDAVAVDSLGVVLPDIAGRLISILICISTLGAVNGLIFTGARISYALGTEHPLFARLGRWNSRFGTPLWALVLQAAIALLITLLAGSFIDTILYTAPVVWLFFLATCVSVWRLRRKEPQTLRPFKTPLYPLPTVLFATACVFMLYNSVTYALGQKPLGFAIAIACLLAGVVVYAVTRRKSSHFSM